MKAFIIDDDSFYTSMVEQQLSNCNVTSIFKYIEVNQALEDIKLEKPDILLLDLCLKDNVAVDYIPRFKLNSNNTNIVVMTSLKDEKIKKDSINKGAYAFTEKNNQFYANLKNIIEEIKMNISNLFDDVKE